MKTIKLDKNTPSLDEILAIARRESLLLVLPDGTKFLVEEADDFDREIAELGSSEKFMNFLAERSREKGVISIDQFANELDSRDT